LQAFLKLSKDAATHSQGDRPYAHPGKGIAEGLNKYVNNFENFLKNLSEQSKIND